MVKLIVALCYIAAILVIGILSSKRVKTYTDFSVAGRTIPFWRNVHSMSSASIGAGATMGVAGLAYAVGISSFVLGIGSALGTALFAIVFARQVRLAEATSIPGLVRLKLGPKVAAAVNILVIVSLFAAFAGQLRSLGIIIQQFIGGISLPVAIIVMTAIVVIYGALGGLVASTKTDSLNMVIMLFSAMIILPILVLTRAGGFKNMVATLEPRYFNPLGMGGLAMLGLFLWILPSGMIGAENFQRVCGAKSAKEGQAALLVSSLGVCLPYMLVCGVLGIAGAVLVPKLANSDAVFPSLIDVLTSPALGAFLLAGLLAAVMGTAASLVIITSATFTENVTKMVKPDLSARGEMLSNRIAVLAFAVLGIVVAITGRSIVGIMQDVGSPATAAVLPIFVAMFFWKRTTEAGAMAAVFVGVISTLAWWIYGLFALKGASPLGIHHIIIGLICASVAVIVGSLATYRGTGDAGVAHGKKGAA